MQEEGEGEEEEGEGEGEDNNYNILRGEVSEVLFVLTAISMEEGGYFLALTLVSRIVRRQAAANRPTARSSHRPW